MSATRATWKEWLTASDRCKPVIPGKSYAEVLKTDLQSQRMQSREKMGWPPSKGAFRASLRGGGHVANMKNQGISSDSPACKNIARVNVKVAPAQNSLTLSVTLAPWI